jgi:hypothetical protein
MTDFLERLPRLEERFLERLRQRFEAGDKAMLLYSLNHCLTNNLPIPPWLATAFREACEKGHRLKVKSWDEVFSPPLKKGQQIEAARRKMEKAEPLFDLISERRKAGASINKELFETVGKEVGLSGTVAEEIYYGVLKDMAEADAFLED